MDPYNSTTHLERICFSGDMLLRVARLLFPRNNAPVPWRLVGVGLDLYWGSANMKQALGFEFVLILGRTLILQCVFEVVINCALDAGRRRL